jgi:hypothetical protein
MSDDTYGGIYQVVVESGPLLSSPDNLYLFADGDETSEPSTAAFNGYSQRRQF